MSKQQANKTKRKQFILFLLTNKQYKIRTTYCVQVDVFLCEPILTADVDNANNGLLPHEVVDRILGFD